MNLAISLSLGRGGGEGEDWPPTSVLLLVARTGPPGKLKGEAVLLTIDLLSVNHLAFDFSQTI